MFPHVFRLAALVVPLIYTAVDRALDDEQVYNGKVLRAGEGQLVLTMGTEQLTFMVTKETTITLDGEPAKLEKIQHGYSAQVKGQRVGDEFTAISITAKAEVIVNERR
jgi:hypothetical protein